VNAPSYKNRRVLAVLCASVFLFLIH